MSNAGELNGTPRASCQSSMPTNVQSPTWPAPKSPLPPHRLAKLANALGVSTPIPTIHSPAFLSRSLSDSSGPPDTFGRSPTPSTPSLHHLAPYPTSVSKFLLHVVPPSYLPHDTGDDTDLTPPPSNASGYHTQFRRGILVPMYSSFQSQLAAIAKEYALPSTAGLILYLVASARISSGRSPTPSADMDDETDEPGPRLSEDIWRHLWTRVVKVEREDGFFPPSRSNTPNLFAISNGTQSTPFLPQDPNTQPPLLRPLISARADTPPQLSPFSPSSATPSSFSDARSNTKSSDAPSSSSLSHSDRDPDTPDTSSPSQSFDPVVRANSLDLPGLHSTSVIPVLAKVEFDIDRRKAAWYEPWLRSRKVNHAKRAESRAGRKASLNEGPEKADGRERYPPIDLLTGRKQTASPMPFLSPGEEKQAVSDMDSKVMAEVINAASDKDAGYQPLSDSQEKDGWSDDDDDADAEFTEEITARVALVPGKDPLTELFGTDADTWADIKNSSERKPNTNPNIVDLALNAADLSVIPDGGDSNSPSMKDVDEVQALLERMSQPQLGVFIPSSPPDGHRKHVPPPLVLMPNVPAKDLAVPSTLSPQVPSSASSVNLAYLDGSSESSSGHAGAEDDDLLEVGYARVKTPAETEKREGAVFDDLDLGLDPTEEFDENDPDDRRRSQLLMKAKLDEIERTMAQLSPRVLQMDLDEEQGGPGSRWSPNTTFNLSPGRLLNMDVFPPSPLKPDSEVHSIGGHEANKSLAWPAVPFSALNEPGLVPAAQDKGLPPPPQLAVNGITTAAPKPFITHVRTSMSEISAETESRRRELEEQERLAAPLKKKGSPSKESPVIPLSPDPFGRFSSSQSAAGGPGPVSTYWEHSPVVSQSSETANAAEQYAEEVHGHTRNQSTVTSRFSVDSIAEDQSSKANNRSTALGTIKRLWRKSNKSSAASSKHVSPTPVTERPSQELQDGPPKTPTFGRFSPQLVPRPSQEVGPLPTPSQQQQQQLAVPPAVNSQQLTAHFPGRPANHSPIIPTQMLPNRSTPTLDRLKFDQESPYPIHPSVVPRPSTSHSRSTSGAQSPEPSTSAGSPVPPPLLDKEKPSVRKSILKSWKSVTATSVTPPPPVPEPRRSLDRLNGQTVSRSRRPSVINFGSTRSSTPTSVSDIPPSPQIPQQFIGQQRQEKRQSVKSRKTGSSIDSTHSSHQRLSAMSSSPRRSMASSRSSQETRPSFDASQFEIVSPKQGSTLSYPYHGLDHE